MKNATYDKLKGIALLVAPVLVFIGAVLNIWNVPYTAQITATLAALDTLVGALVTVAKGIYDKGIHDGEKEVE